MKAIVPQKLVKAYKPPKYSKDLQKIFKRIKEIAAQGGTLLVLDENTPYLQGSEFAILETLGYSVTAREYRNDFIMYGIVSWALK